MILNASSEIKLGFSFEIESFSLKTFNEALNVTNPLTWSQFSSSAFNIHN